MCLPKVFFCLIVLSSVAQVRLSAQKLGTYSRHALSYERQEGVYDDFDQEGKVVTKGISYGFARGVGVSRAIPLAVEFGGRLAWTHGVDKDFYYKISRKEFLSVVLPINAAYRISLFRGNLAVAPFLGPSFRFNLIGRHYYEYRYQSNGKSENYLSRRLDSPANIFQFGGDIGLGLVFRKLYVGYTFQCDFTSYMDKLNYGDPYVPKSDFRTRSSLVSVGLEL